MKTIISLFLLSTLVASAQIVTFSSSATLSGTVTIGAVQSSSPSYLYQQDFESGTEPANWTHSGIVNYNYTTAPAPLLGSLSLEDSAGGHADYSYSPDLTEVYGFFIVNDATGNEGLFSILRAGFGTEMLIAQNQSGGGQQLQVIVGAQSANTVATFATGTTIYVWWHYKQGTGSNAIGEIWWSTNTTKPANGSNNYQIVPNGTSTDVANQFRCGGGTGATILDHFILSASPIGSNP